MINSPKKEKQKKQNAPMPFDEALKRVWAAPPQHKKTKKGKKKS
jgi:hypothetical protein